MKGSVTIPPKVDLTARRFWITSPKHDPVRGRSEPPMLLLDTCAVIWMVLEEPMALTAVAAMTRASH